MFIFNLFKAEIPVKAYQRKGQRNLVFVHPYTRTSSIQALQIARKKQLSDFDLQYLLHHYDTVINKLAYSTAARYGLPNWAQDTAQDIREGILKAHAGDQTKRRGIDWWTHYLRRGLGWANEKLKQVRSILSTDNKRKDFEDYTAIRKYEAMYQQTMNEEATTDKVADALKISVQRVQALRDVYSKTLSPDQNLEGEEGSTPIITLVSTGEEPGSELERNELNEKLESTIQQILNRREYDIFQWGYNHDGDFTGFFGGGSPNKLRGIQKTVYEHRLQGTNINDIAKKVGKSYRETYEIYKAMKKNSGVYDAQKNTPSIDRIKLQQAFDRIVAKLAGSKQVIELKEEFVTKAVEEGIDIGFSKIFFL